jgi:hypothetical protein
METDEEYKRVVELIRGEFSVEEDLFLIELIELRRYFNLSPIPPFHLPLIFLITFLS